MMNRSFRAQESQMTLKQRQQVVASLRNSLMKEQEDDLALFMEMRKRDKEREKERDSLLLPNSNEFEDPLGSKPETSPIFNIAASTPVPLRKTGPADFLNSENDKNDYDWLLTPPGTPLFPSLETERQRTYMGQLGTPKGRSTSVKSRLANPHIEIPKRNSLVPKQPASCAVSSSVGIRRPSSSGGVGSRPTTPTGRATLASSRPATPTGRATLTAPSRTSRPSTPTPRATNLSSNTPTMVPTSRSAGPTRSTTPLSRPVARASTPTGRASIPASNAVLRASTPTRRPSASPSSANTSGSFSRSSFLTKSVNSGMSLTRSSEATPTKAPVSSSVRTVTAVPKSSASSRAPSPPMKSRPWKPSEMPGFSMEAPPNLITSAPDRSISASRGRPVASGCSSSVEPGLAGRPKRQSCSPSRGRISNGFAHPSGSSVPALRRTPKVSDNVNPILMGTRMVDRVINMRKLPPPQDEKSPSLSGKSASSPDSSGFGRNLSKKSLDMAIRHMDIRSIPGNLRPLMTNIPASSMYSVRSGSGPGRGGVQTRGRTMSVSDSPLATSSNASSELSVNNNGLTIDLSELEDDNGSERGVGTPSSICGR